MLALNTKLFPIELVFILFSKFSSSLQVLLFVVIFIFFNETRNEQRASNEIFFYFYPW